MIAADEDALVCDFAQVYHVLNWRELPVRLAATLAAGLPPDSRSMMLLAGEKVTLENTLRAIIADSLARFEWRMFGGTGSPRPVSILAALRGVSEEKSSNIQTFDSPEEFEAAMAAIEGGETDGH